MFAFPSNVLVPPQYQCIGRNLGNNCGKEKPLIHQVNKGPQAKPFHLEKLTRGQLAPANERCKLAILPNREYGQTALP